MLPRARRGSPAARWAGHARPAGQWVDEDDAAPGAERAEIDRTAVGAVEGQGWQPDADQRGGVGTFGGTAGYDLGRGRVQRVPLGGQLADPFLEVGDGAAGRGHLPRPEAAGAMAVRVAKFAHARRQNEVVAKGGAGRDSHVQV